MTLRAVLFDLDGTLIDSHGALRAAYEAFLERTGIEGDGGGFARWDGTSLRSVVETLASEHGLGEEPEALLAMYFAIAQDEYASAALAEGARALLARTTELGLRSALVTSAPRELVTRVLERQALTFEVTVCAEDVTETKPSPMPYTTALAKLGLGPNDAVAIEDSPSGARSAASAGLACVAVCAVERVRALRAGGAGVVVTDLVEAAAVVESLVRFSGRVVRAQSVEAKLVGDMPALPASDEQRVLDYFEAAALARPSLTDGPIASLRSWSVVAGVLSLEIERARYRHVLARAAGLPTPLHAIGVTGILRVREAGGAPARIVLGKRSAAVTQFPGFWELVPSGSLAVGERTVDPAAQIREELDEEISLPAGTTIEISPLGLVEDVSAALTDIAYRIEALVPAGTAGAVRPGAEYDDLVLLTHEELVTFLADNDGRVVPTAHALLELASA